MTGISEHTETLDGQPVFWRAAPPADGGSPILYVHGVPTNSDLWAPFLQRTGGIAVDLPGFGRSGKRGDLDYSVPGLARFVGRFLELVGADEVRLVVHGWGACALRWAQDEPERIERLVVVDAVPLLPGLRWHRLARAWRTRGVGEVAMGLSVRPALRCALPRELVGLVADHLDQGTQRAILELYRWADPDVLAACGAGLGEIDARALVLWGERDPYIPASFAFAYADALGGDAAVEIVGGAGHWPWLGRAEVVGRVDSFLRDR
ncbi:MAG TPA: alpha/beta hydrolase [Capillimicrobium sp.]